MRLAATVAAFALTAAPAIAQDMTAPRYPETHRGPTVETLFGEEVADPYRWLEDDVRNSPEVAQWVAQQNAVTDAYLAQLPARPWFNRRIGEIFDFARYSTPYERGGRYFYTHNTGLQNQSPLYVRDSLEGEARLLIDPNAWAQDGATALDSWRPSPDGSKLLYSVQDGGSDWRILRVLDVASGEPLGEEIRWAKFTSLAWVGEEGFLYSRFPEPAEGEDFQALNYNQAVYFHRIGTPQSADELVYATPGHPEQNHTAGVTHDGRWAIITSSIGTDARYEVRAIDLAARAAQGWQARELVTGFDNSWSVVEGIGGRLFVVTNKDAPRYRALTIDLDSVSPAWTELVAEREQPISGASVVGDRLVLSYLRDASSAVSLFTLEGTPAGEVELAGIGSVGGFSGEPGKAEAFYSFTSFNRPPTVYRWDMASGERTTFAEADLAFDPERFVVEQRFFASKDGTRVPMFIMRRRDLADAGAAVPTLLYGYGGFDISLTPGFSASRIAWVEAGGAYVVANIRGGGEYGKAWHDGGRRANKQNVFDDFIAAGEFLIAEGITPADGLAIQGGSNGGLLVGAVANQRPDLFAAGNASVGVMDMLRFDRWTAGRYWVDDYGYPDREEDWRILRGYSPLHNIRPGVDYPALLVTTADTDDRVVPGHSFKYTAALQAAGLGDRPQLIRIETRAGHGSGKPTDKAIAEAADVMSFLARWTGLQAP
ncbi:prolyl oligopeptidase family serine peptidase [Altererythrobacter sp. KTW20L]|uniref:prolyl oligopeptidase family serine peptidase n=1 Tax=Altererythrobacter sp. KTW20L TaxID=2942210 RepID=UPI0020BF6BC9|nr:prolyl oligopeptidase family serine peptidase [Altererythrobacter sp. KTW20L]MCL6251723.1 prolyl oligopeptidase family serine peptidase [Altererythrobacter sp. KTW20L]